MGSPTIFSGSRTKVLTSKGFQLSSGVMIDNDGPVNYIKNATFENDLNGWATYVGGTTVPTSGTGGSANITITRSTTTPLRGGASLLLTKDAVNRQGQGFSYDFTIDRSDRSQVLRASFEYESASGTYSDDVLEIFIYDVTNSTLIFCSPSKLKNASANEKFTFEFQATTSTLYRLIAHIASTSSNAFTMKFDNFKIGPYERTYGSPITDWALYTPTFGGMGTTSAPNVLYRRNGANLEVNGVVTTGTISGVHTISIPVGLTVDSSRLSITNNTTSNPGTVVGRYAQSATNAQGCLVTAPGSATNLVYVGGNAGASATAITPTAASLGDTAQLSFNFSVPIVGWAAQTQIILGDVDSKIIGAIVTGGATTVTTNNPIIYPTVTKDTHGAYNSSTGRYTCPTGGLYQVNVGGPASAGTFTRLAIFKNGANYNFIGFVNSTDGSMAGCGVVDCAAGDIIDVRPTTANIGTPGGHISIFRVAGSAQIFASETIAVKYTDSSAASIGAASAIYKFLTKEIDSHGSYSPSTGLFTCPAPGSYKIDAHLSHVTALSTNQQCDIMIYKNGVSIKRHTMFGNGVGNRKSLILSDLVRLSAGDTIGIYAYSDVATNTMNDVQYNSFSIVKVGL